MFGMTEGNYRRVKKKFSPAGNRTPVSRVTGGDTHHYTTTLHYTKVRTNQQCFIKLPKVGVQQCTFFWFGSF